jgi:geranyl-CoA carboxylase alpha subunit
MRLDKILIANRGEIACRVIRTARAMGYRTVAVFSDADAAAPHVAGADEAVRIGGAAASDSYLRVDAILQAARRIGADAVHPGYGFLSENAGFASACADGNLVFIGPPPEAIRIMSDKALAKARMVQAGVPVVQGAPAVSAAAAAAIGYPVMVKAVAGGGGRGMRLVQNEDGLADAMASASREAQSAFGDGSLMLEAFIRRGQHIEFQIFADSHGNFIHLGERDCTAQRRRQKLIEESPSLALDHSLRARMAEAALLAARAVAYQGAGTIEFILDDTGQFYFLEMNTRLQVEHTVTECVTGLDLVEWQIRVARGEALPRQADIRFAGHAIEARLCAEDAYDDFAPQTGAIKYWSPGDAGIRVDSGIVQGGAVSPHYDSMVAKLIAHGPTRQDAIRRLVAGLDASPLLGLSTNAGFLKSLLQSDEFVEARIHTGMIDGWAGTAILRRPAVTAPHLALAAAILASPRYGFRNRGEAAYGMVLHTLDERFALRVQLAGETVTVRHGESAISVTIVSRDGPHVCFEIDGVRGRAIAVQDGAALHLAVDGDILRFTEPSAATVQAATDPWTVTTPVAGQLLAILPVDTIVAPGDALAVIEAMKIETRVCATVAARMGQVFAAAGTQVAAKAILAKLVPMEEPA